jgi:hypothetical protein
MGDDIGSLRTYIGGLRCTKYGGFVERGVCSCDLGLDAVSVCFKVIFQGVWSMVCWARVVTLVVAWRFA